MEGRKEGKGEEKKEEEEDGGRNVEREIKEVKEKDGKVEMRRGRGERRNRQKAW